MSTTQSLHRHFTRQLSGISEHAANVADSFFQWFNSHRNESTSNFIQTQANLNVREEEAWTPEQLYLLIRCFEDTGVLTAAARKFTSIANRSYKSTFKRINELNIKISMLSFYN